MARTLQDIIASVPAAVRWKLDQEIDFEHRDITDQVIPQDLGRIAESMVEWDGVVADFLGLTERERTDIRDSKPKLQRREALNKWKSKLGKAATYRALIEVFFRAGKVDYADAVCYLFKDPSASSDLPGVGSTSPTTASHAQTTSAPTNTTAGHIGFSPSMGPDSLAQWLRQEYGSDYPEDVEKLCKARIKGRQLLSSISTMISGLELSLGFQMEIKERVEQLKEKAGATTLPSNSAASSPPAHTSPPSTQIHPNADFDRFEVKHHHVSRIEWRDTVTGETKIVRVYNKAAWKWRKVADNLGLEPGEIQGIQRNNYDDDERVTDVFRRWFDNANNLPNKNRYPKKWSGLIRLLDDSELGELSKELEKALSAPNSSVQGNLY